MWNIPNSPLEVSSALADRNYLADEGLATVVYLAISMQRPLFLEGDAGVGKTELAKVLASWTGGELIRLQCYEGIDASQALYEPCKALFKSSFKDLSSILSVFSKALRGLIEHLRAFRGS